MSNLDYGKYKITRRIDIHKVSEWGENPSKENLGYFAMCNLPNINLCRNRSMDLSMCFGTNRGSFGRTTYVILSAYELELKQIHMDWELVHFKIKNGI